MAQPSTEISAALDGTIAALQSGLTSLPPETAVETIKQWQQQLQGTPIAPTLGELKLMLKSDSPAGGTSQHPGTLLSQLGDQVAALKGTTDPDLAPRLEQLSQLLKQAGQSLKDLQ